jgi:FtsH-binding integral membrane protein
VNGDFIRREWGAVTFVLTVIVGIIVVPVALYFANQGPSPVSTAVIGTSSSPVASSAITTSPSPSPSHSPSPSPSHSP